MHRPHEEELRSPADGTKIPAQPLAECCHINDPNTLWNKTTAQSSHKMGRNNKLLMLKATKF